MNKKMRLALLCGAFMLCAGVLHAEPRINGVTMIPPAPAFGQMVTVVVNYCADAYASPGIAIAFSQNALPVSAVSTGQGQVFVVSNMGINVPVQNPGMFNGGLIDFTANTSNGYTPNPECSTCSGTANGLSYTKSYVVRVPDSSFFLGCAVSGLYLHTVMNNIDMTSTDWTNAAACSLETLSWSIPVSAASANLGTKTEGVFMSAGDLVLFSADAEYTNGSFVVTGALPGGGSMTLVDYGPRQLTGGSVTAPAIGATSGTVTWTFADRTGVPGTAEGKIFLLMRMTTPLAMGTSILCHFQGTLSGGPIYNAYAGIVVGQGNLSVKKFQNKDSAVLGETVTYSLSYEVNGNRLMSYRSFDDLASGTYNSTPPVGWSFVADSGTNGTWTVLQDCEIGDKYIIGDSDILQFPMLAMAGADAEFCTGLLYGEAMISDGGYAGADALFVIRQNNLTGVSQKYYGVLLSIDTAPAGGFVSIQKCDEGACSWYGGTSSVVIESKRWYSIKVNTPSTDSFQVKVWPKGEPEPNGWTTEWTDPSPSAGMHCVTSGLWTPAIGQQSGPAGNVMDAYNNIMILESYVSLNASVYDTIPTGIVYGGSLQAPVSTSPVVRWNLGSVSYASGSYTWWGQVTSCGPVITNMAAISGTGNITRNSNPVNLSVTGCGTPVPSITSTQFPSPTFTSTASMTVTLPAGTSTFTATPTRTMTVTITPGTTPGEGAAVISPPTVYTYSTNNIITLTYTNGPTMWPSSPDYGTIRITIPDTWDPPPHSSIIMPGYYTVSVTNGELTGYSTSGRVIIVRVRDLMPNTGTITLVYGAAPGAGITAPSNAGISVFTVESDPYGIGDYRPIVSQPYITVIAATPLPTKTPTATMTAIVPVGTGTFTRTVTPTPTRTMTMTITITTGLPDLRITNMYSNIKDYQFGQCVNMPAELGVQVDYENIGASTAGPFVIEINGNTRAVSGLAPGASGSVWFGPGNPGSTIGTIDSTGVIAEADESNNVIDVVVYATPTLPPTCAPTSVFSPTFTATVTRTITPCCMISSTPTATRTRTMTVTISPTPDDFTDGRIDIQIPGNNGSKDTYVDTSGRIITATLEWSDGCTCYIIVLYRYLPDGTLDTSFGTGGRLECPGPVITTQFETNITVKCDASGNIIVASTTDSCGGTCSDVIIYRFTSTGAPDNTFGGGQCWRTYDNLAGGNGNDILTSMDIDENGRLVCTGRSWNGTDYDMFVLRCNADGTRDTSFAVNGCKTVHNTGGGNGYDSGNKVVCSGGKIYVIGESASDDPGCTGICRVMCVWRLNQDGSEDTTFGTGGCFKYINTAAGHKLCSPRSIVITAGGKIVITGFVTDGNECKIVCKKMITIMLNMDGTYETYFGTNGIIQGLNGSEGISVIEDSGKLVIGMNIYNNAERDAVVRRYNMNGTLDASFNGTGEWRHNYSYDDECTSVLRITACKLLVSGSMYRPATGYDTVIWQLEDLCPSVTPTSTITLTPFNTPTSTMTPCCGSASLNVRVIQTGDPCISGAPYYSVRVDNTGVGPVDTGTLRLRMWYYSATNITVNTTTVTHYPSAYVIGAAANITSYPDCVIAPDRMANKMLDITLGYAVIAPGEYLTINFGLLGDTPFDAGCDDYSRFTTIIMDSPYVCLYENNILITEQTSYGVIDPLTGVEPCSIPMGSPTFTRTATRTLTVTLTPTMTVTRTATPTFTRTVTPYFTMTATPTATLCNGGVSPAFTVEMIFNPENLDYDIFEITSSVPLVSAPSITVYPHGGSTNKPPLTLSTTLIPGETLKYRALYPKTTGFGDVDTVTIDGTDICGITGSYTGNFEKSVIAKRDVVPFSNVFNPDTGDRVRYLYNIYGGTTVKIKVYSRTGALVNTLFEGVLTDARQYEVTWDGKNSEGKTVVSGIYVVVFETDHYTVKEKTAVTR